MNTQLSGEQRSKNSFRREYSSPKLEEWGKVASMTKLGGSGGPGDVQFNPQGKEIGNPDDGSVFPFD